jgi:hypothetical protein
LEIIEICSHAWLKLCLLASLIPKNDSSFIFFFIFQKGFVEAHVDDGLLEIFGLKQGWHASFVMVELISAKHIAQVL